VQLRGARDIVGESGERGWGRYDGVYGIGKPFLLSPA